MAVKCCSCWRLGVPPSWLVLCGAILVQVGYGLYPVLVKKFAVVNNPVIFTFYRDALCAPLLFFCAILVERKLLFPRPKMLLVFLFLGMTGAFGSQWVVNPHYICLNLLGMYQEVLIRKNHVGVPTVAKIEAGVLSISTLLYILGVYLAGPNIASSIQPIVPVWTTILSIITCTEKIPAPLHLHTWVKVFGIIIAVGGAIEIALMQDKDDSDSASLTSSALTTSLHPHTARHISKHILGYICFFGNTILTGVYIVIQKRFIFNQKNSIWKSQPIYVTAYSYAFGTFFMGLASLYYVGKKQFDSFVIEGETFYALIYAVFITSAVCYLLFSWSNMHLSPTVVTAFWPVQVLVTALAAFFITGDQLAPLQYIGAVLVILALFMVLFSNYMDERLQSERRVPQINCRLSKPPPLPNVDDFEYIVKDDERMALLAHLPKEYLTQPPTLPV